MRNRKSEPKKRHQLDRRAGFIIKAMESEGKPDDLLDSAAVAFYLGVHPSWCELTRHKGHGPEFQKFGTRCVLYRRDAVIKWLRGRIEQPATKTLAQFYEARA